MFISVPVKTVQGWHTVTFSGEPVSHEVLTPDKFRAQTLPIFLDKAGISYEWSAKRPSKNKDFLDTEEKLKKEAADKGLIPPR